MGAESCKEPRSLVGYTETAEGFIPHRRHASGIDMPVLLQTMQDEKGRMLVKLKNGLPVPVRDYARRVCYALPGGGVFTGAKQWR